MTSNFSFLQNDAPDLTALAQFAERYVHSDPASALVKLRNFIERMVTAIYQHSSLPMPIRPSLVDLLNNDGFRALAHKVIQDKLHAVRIHGNKAAHGEEISVNTSCWLLKEGFDLACWYYLAQLDGKHSDLPEYREPPAEEGIKARLKQEKKAALEKLAAQEAQLETLLAELGEAQQKVVDLQTAQQNAKAAVDVLQFDEATTRKRLIDSLLNDVGWQVGYDDVTLEEAVLHQPTQSSTGYADYVLWDDNGKPLAVVEAKKASVNAEKGRTQAKLYADGLEKMHGQRPVIFYTNGFEIWIWDDAQGYPPRRLFGFYSKDSLQYLLFQRHNRKALDDFSPKPDIAGRLYQVESIKRVCERFTDKHRKALIVQATGTGKTRVAIALTELLIRASWVKRVLFLCDRKELRKQAKTTFVDWLNEPLVIVSASTAKDREKRIYLATYPAMVKIYQNFDPGFFDLVIADESHRSIYNVYGDLFHWFDCLQVGLTATPVEFVSRNTYQLFGCENQAPTAYYSFERAVDDRFLVPFEVKTFTTDFLRRGIKYHQLNETQRQQLEEDGEDVEQLAYEVKDVDKNIYNKDTSRHILRNLMENGIRDASGQQVGKSILFARNHDHAVHLSTIFDDMYPQYGGHFCQVIDNYDPRAEQLIDDFKQADNPLTIAISVDMLDTGIDVPEVVNLVFAKPVYSKVKFWQMIGRGTRLCPNLFGPGKDKQKFLIFDHWGNFDYFEFHYKAVEPTPSKSLMQQVFETRLEVADVCLQAAQPDYFDSIAELLLQDINALPDDSIAVREKWKTKHQLAQAQTLKAWAPATVSALKTELAPLMQWRNIRGYTDAYELDLLMGKLEHALLRQSAQFDDVKITLLDKVNSLQMHLNPVREKADVIRQVRSSEFWQTVTLPELERVRQELRTIIHHRDKTVSPPQPAKILDITEDTGQIETAARSSSMTSVDMKVYEQQVEAALKDLFDSEPVLKKIRRGEAVTETELQGLTALILTQNPDVRLDVLQEFYPEAGSLDTILRGIIGMEPDAVKARFEQFVHKHPKLTAKQTRFLSLLENHLAKYGKVEIERLYEDPFTMVDSDGIDGVFPDAEADELIRIIESFNQPTRV